MQNIPNEDREAAMAKMDTNELIAEVRRLWEFYTPKGEPMDQLENALRMFARGCISGHVTEWPQLVPALKWAADEIDRLRSSPEKDLGREGNKDLTASPLNPEDLDFEKHGIKEILEAHSAYTKDLEYVLLRRFEFLRSDIFQSIQSRKSNQALTEAKKETNLIDNLTFLGIDTLSGERSEPSKSPPVGPSPMKLDLDRIATYLINNRHNLSKTERHLFYELLGECHRLRKALKGTAKESPKLREWLVMRHPDKPHMNLSLVSPGPEIGYMENIVVREVPQSNPREALAEIIRKLAFYNPHESHAEFVRRINGEADKILILLGLVLQSKGEAT